MTSYFKDKSGEITHAHCPSCESQDSVKLKTDNSELKCSECGETFDQTFTCNYCGQITAGPEKKELDDNGCIACQGAKESYDKF